VPGYWNFPRRHILKLMDYKRMPPHKHSKDLRWHRPRQNRCGKWKGPALFSFGFRVFLLAILRQPRMVFVAVCPYPAVIPCRQGFHPCPGNCWHEFLSAMLVRACRFPAERACHKLDGASTNVGCEDWPHCSGCGRGRARFVSSGCPCSWHQRSILPFVWMLAMLDSCAEIRS